MSTTPLRRVRAAGLAAAGAIAVAAAGCGGADDDRLPPLRTHAPTPSPTPTLDPMDAEVLAALDAYIEVIVAARTNPDQSDYGLEEVALPRRVATLTNTIQADLRDGVQFQGSKRIVSAEVIEYNLEAESPNVYVETCLDISDYSMFDIETGEPVPGTPFNSWRAFVDHGEVPDQHSAWFRFHLLEGRWLLSSFVGIPEEPC